MQSRPQFLLPPHAWPAMRRAGHAAASTLAHVCARVRPGTTTRQVDRWVRRHTRELGGTPSQLGYNGFPASVCVSPNDIVCHGIPSDKVVLGDGDIVNIDVTTKLAGFHGDTSRMVLVGTPSVEARHLVHSCIAARDAGIAVVRPGAQLGDIGHAIQRVAAAAGCSVVEEYGGHGIGRSMHLPPHVHHTGRAGEGLVLRVGMCFTIEPMLNLGAPQIAHDPDGWTVRTKDGSLSAQCEHTILVTESGVEVLTLPPR